MDNINVKFNCNHNLSACCRNGTGKHDASTMKLYIEDNQYNLEPYYAMLCQDQVMHEDKYGWRNLISVTDHCVKCLRFFPELQPDALKGHVICADCKQ